MKLWWKAMLWKVLGLQYLRCSPLGPVQRGRWHSPHQLAMNNSSWKGWAAGLGTVLTPKWDPTFLTLMENTAIMNRPKQGAANAELTGQKLDRWYQSHEHLISKKITTILNFQEMQILLRINRNNLKVHLDAERIFTYISSLLFSSKSRGNNCRHSRNHCLLFHCVLVPAAPLPFLTWEV